MRHRWRHRPGGQGTVTVYRCKRCGAVVACVQGDSPYKECRRKGIPEDCAVAVAAGVMDS